jgi:NAD(P)-dependent dehydrogenase (short-subunit alcohol dehydrogenase family)
VLGGGRHTASYCLRGTACIGDWGQFGHRQGRRPCARRIDSDVAINYVFAPTAAEEVAHAVEAADRRAITDRADVSNEEEVQSMFGRVIAHFGTPLRLAPASVPLQKCACYAATKRVGKLVKPDQANGTATPHKIAIGKNAAAPHLA